LHVNFFWVVWIRIVNKWYHCGRICSVCRNIFWCIRQTDRWAGRHKHKHMCACAHSV